MITVDNGLIFAALVLQEGFEGQGAEEGIVGGKCTYEICHVRL